MMPQTAIFTTLLVASLLFFCWSVYRRFSLLCYGQPEERLDQPARRLAEMFLYAFAQLRVLRKPFGLNHFVIFWSFMILALANGEFLVNGVFPSVSLALLPEGVHRALLLAFDAVSLLTLFAIAFSFIRRLVVKPPHLDSLYVKGRSPEAFLILSFIALLMLAYFGLHGSLIALGMEDPSAMPVSSLVGSWLSSHPDLIPALRNVSWWLHAFVLFAFICFLPHSKHMHILTAIPNCYFGALAWPATQPREKFEKGAVYGVGTVERFTWKDLFDSFTCTECGRCQAACPATITGKALNPRQIVHAIKTNLLENGDALREGRSGTLPLIGAEGEGTNTEDAIWSCTTCGACMEACPVLIEQMPKIVKMRRHLVETESRFPEELLNLFENMEQRSNPWGIAPGERAKWVSTLPVKPFVAGETEYLLYVGCAGSFDSRAKQVTVALATVLNAAGISWGILGKDEKCCGDSLRRLGNEYLFEKMALENVELFRQRGVTKVITLCPHCLTTLKNDYRQYGLELEVVHQSELIADLIRSGRIKLDKKDDSLGKIAYHDPCYLGRHNDIFEAPRTLVQAATGVAPVETERHGRNSFCCGAGGGRMWMEEFTGERVNHARVDELLAQKPDTICVACPYCMTMMEDGLKDKGAGQVRVRDVVEVLAEGLLRKNA
ncbi:(Fe-S)-binding protein [Geomonas sp. Red69]|uniref:heterodisulfide reductase-related iron-sulfur binding cluster n=1 Tax=Geomonas diazotrophica TaxID=2843197 RepID=UPI001C126AB6|nr:(Fe-S)-binding protein [Geomonas diazotrophica]MBU5636181.1 (Fe-S)-binding protein [Geomonas diazotrophica]